VGVVASESSAGEERTAGSDGSEAPFFIVGSDRSGTTLLRLMLNAHSRLHVPRESWFLIDLMEALPADRPLDSREIERGIRTILRHPRWPDWDVPEPVLRARLAERGHGVDLAGLVDVTFRVLADAAGKPRWGDKTPAYVHHIAPLARLFDRARFVHVIRDGRDVCLSLRRLRWHGTTVYHHARYWTRAVQAGMREGQALGPERYLELRYEDLVEQPESELRRVCAFLGESFESGMLRFHEDADRQIAAWERSIHRKLFRPPRRSDLELWRGAMSARQLAVVEAWAGETLRRAGYALEWSGPKRIVPLLLRSAYPAIALLSRMRRALGLGPAPPTPGDPPPDRADA